MAYDDLRAACIALGLDGDRHGRFERALDQARDAGMLAEVTRRRDGKRMIEIRSTLKVAQLYNLETIGARPVLVPAEKVAKLKDWRAALFATFHEGMRSERTKSNPIAQSTLRILTSVPERTQYNYNRLAPVTTRRNIAVTGRLAEYHGRFTDAMKDAMQQHAGVFAVNDKNTGQKLVAWSLPASYTTNLDRTPRGRNRKINSTLKGGLVIVAAGQQQKGRAIERRVFWEDEQACLKQTLRDLKPLGAGEKYADRPQERYSFVKHGERSGAGIWRVW